MRRSVAVKVVLVLVLPLLAQSGAQAQDDLGPPEGEWVAGDLHVHTTYSHDAWGPPDQDPTQDPTNPGAWELEDLHTFGWTVADQIRIAEVRGLDYVAITDHNDVRAAHDPGFASDQLVLVPGYEASLQGHAQLLGVDHCYGPEGASEEIEDCDRSFAGDVEKVNELAERVRAAGGIFQANHPAYRMTAVRPGVEETAAWDWRYGFEVVPDAMEVWNIGWPWQPPAPSANSNDDAVRLWEAWLDRGFRVAATGGSDNHWRSTTAVQGVGQPTTWVYVSDRSLEGVLEGVRAGRTFVSHQPPAHGGPLLFLEADATGDGAFDTMVGGDAPEDAAYRVRVENAVPGAWLRVVTSEGELPLVTVTGPVFEHGFEVPAGTSWVRAELLAEDAQALREDSCEPMFGTQTTYCRNRLAMLALTSAIYVT